MSMRMQDVEEAAVVNGRWQRLAEGVLPSRLTRRLGQIRAFMGRNEKWYTAPYVSEASPIVVGGCGRSGTTLMRVILDSHKNICCGPESSLLFSGRPLPRRLSRLGSQFDLPLGLVQQMLKTSSSQARFAELFFGAYSSATGKPRWADKTPSNVRYLDHIFSHFPKAKFIHMIRDGRDTVCSLRTHPRHKIVDGKLVELNTRNPLDRCMARWVNDVQAGMAYRGDARYIEIKYEDLVLNTEMTLKTLFDFLGEEWDEQVLRFHEVNTASRDVSKFPQNPEATRPITASALGRWRTQMTSEEAAVFKRMAGPLLINLGYASDNEWEPSAQ